MLMKLIKGTVDFAAGVAVGAIAGATAAYLAAPRSGDDLRKESQELIDSAVQAGDRARVDREAELRDKFRAQVGNQQALTTPASNVAFGVEPSSPSIPFPS